VRVQRDIESGWNKKHVGGKPPPEIARNESRQQVVSRLLELMREAEARGAIVSIRNWR
jgi:hypothetical protein